MYIPSLLLFLANYIYIFYIIDREIRSFFFCMALSKRMNLSINRFVRLSVSEIVGIFADGGNDFALES